MMFWWGDHMAGWGWALTTISSIMFWALVIAGVVALVHYVRSAGEHRFEQPSRPTPEQLLAERYARGEIDETEYRQRLDTLEAAGVGRGPTSQR